MKTADLLITRLLAESCPRPLGLWENLFPGSTGVRRTNQEESNRTTAQGRHLQQVLKVAAKTGRQPSMSPTYHIVLADDHVRFRWEIKKFLNEIPEIEIVGEAGEGNELFALLERVRPDLVLLDISMPNLRAMKATRKIKADYPEVKVIIMVMDGESEYLSHAVSAGADGILLKQNSAKELELAIQKVRRGERYFPKPLEESRTDSDVTISGPFRCPAYPPIC